MNYPSPTILPDTLSGPFWPTSSADPSFAILVGFSLFERAVPHSAGFFSLRPVSIRDYMD